MDAGENNIFDLFAGKKLAIKLATDAASTILKVDQVINEGPAFPVGGVN